MMGHLRIRIKGSPIRKRTEDLTRSAVVRVIAISVFFAAQAVLSAAAQEGTEKPITMQRYVVNSVVVHQLNFGLAIEIWKNAYTGKVMDMYVKDVRPGSSAEREGLRPGTKIYGINGISVYGLDATFRAGSELNKIFENRKPGDKVTLEVGVVRNGRREDTFVTLVEDASFKLDFKLKLQPE